MPDVFAALPTRPLHARPPTSMLGIVWSVLGLLLFVAMLAYMLFWVAPDIATDWQVRQNAAVVRDADVSDGKCDGRLFVEICDVTLSAPVGKETVVRRVHYVFGSFHSGDFNVNVVADPAHPEWLTTDQALDTFWNRALTFIAGSVVIAPLVIGGVGGALRTRRHRRAWMVAPAVAVPLQLTALRRFRGVSIWTVKSDSGLTQFWTLPPRASPFVLGPADRILGLATPGGAAIMPLDAKLRWVDLSPAERGPVLAAGPLPGVKIARPKP